MDFFIFMGILAVITSPLWIWAAVAEAREAGSRHHLTQNDYDDLIAAHKALDALYKTKQLLESPIGTSAAMWEGRKARAAKKGTV